MSWPISVPSLPQAKPTHARRSVEPAPTVSMRDFRAHTQRQATCHQRRVLPTAPSPRRGTAAGGTCAARSTLRKRRRQRVCTGPVRLSASVRTYGMCVCLCVHSVLLYGYEPEMADPHVVLFFSHLNLFLLLAQRSCDVRRVGTHGWIQAPISELRACVVHPPPVSITSEEAPRCVSSAHFLRSRAGRGLLGFRLSRASDGGGSVRYGGSGPGAQAERGRANRTFGETWNTLGGTLHMQIRTDAVCRAQRQRFFVHPRVHTWKKRTSTSCYGYR